jgi:hypothetical protein
MPQFICMLLLEPSLHSPPHALRHGSSWFLVGGGGGLCISLLYSVPSQSHTHTDLLGQTKCSDAHRPKTTQHGEDCQAKVVVGQKWGEAVTPIPVRVTITGWHALQTGKGLGGHLQPPPLPTALLPITPKDQSFQPPLRLKNVERGGFELSYILNTCRGSWGHSRKRPTHTQSFLGVHRPNHGL